MYKNILLWLVLGSVLASLFGQFKVTDNTNEISYSQFIQSVKQGNVSSVKIAGSQISGVTALGEEFDTYSPGDLGLMGDLLNNGVSVQATPPAPRMVYIMTPISNSMGASEIISCFKKLSFAGGVA